MHLPTLRRHHRRHCARQHAAPEGRRYFYDLVQQEQAGRQLGLRHWLRRTAPETCAPTTLPSVLFLRFCPSDLLGLSPHPIRTAIPPPAVPARAPLLLKTPRSRRCGTLGVGSGRSLCFSACICFNPFLSAPLSCPPDPPLAISGDPRPPCHPDHVSRRQARIRTRRPPQAGETWQRRHCWPSSWYFCVRFLAGANHPSRMRRTLPTVTWRKAHSVKP